MKMYIQYFQDNFNEALGSDGYRLLDARLNLASAFDKAHEPNFKGYHLFEIRRGNFKSYQVIYSNRKG